MLPSVAIIMRAKNEMPHVKRTLEALSRQTFNAYTLYGIDSGSTDGTRELLENHCDDLTRIAPAEYTPGNVLNRAISKADHSIIILLNADAVPLSDTWLENLVVPIIGRDFDAVFCRQVPRNDARFIVRSDYSRAYNSTGKTGVLFSAAACAFRKELWEQNSFRETGYAEDRDWAKACLNDGARIELLKNCPVEHSHNYTLRQLYRKRFRQAVTLNPQPAPCTLVTGCLREIIRDLIHAVTKLKLHTIPYNTVYRLVIYRALFNGLKEAESSQPQT